MKTDQQDAEFEAWWNTLEGNYACYGEENHKNIAKNAWQVAKAAGIKEALAAADTVRLNLAKRYEDAADTNTCQMDGNMDWARLEGAVKAVKAIHALKKQKHED